MKKSIESESDPKILRYFSKCRMQGWTPCRAFMTPAFWTPILLALISVILISLVTGCGSRDFLLEYKISKKLEEFRKNDAELIDLNEILGNDWRKICLQWPYGFNDALEKVFNEKLPEELALGPNDNGLWIFYNDGSAKAVVISRKVMDYQ